MSTEKNRLFDIWRFTETEVTVTPKADNSAIYSAKTQLVISSKIPITISSYLKI